MALGFIPLIIPRIFFRLAFHLNSIRTQPGFNLAFRGEEIPEIHETEGNLKPRSREEKGQEVREASRSEMSKRRWV